MWLAFLLPPPLQSGIMATVGWGLYKLAFDVLSVPGPEAALAGPGDGGEQGGSLALLAEGARLWLHASLG